VEFIVSAVAVLLMLVPFWKITAKAGFNPAWSLLLLVPLVNFVFIYYLAFAKWPSLNE
jgi:hypothetical protein